jgi:hypothetical protein
MKKSFAITAALAVVACTLAFTPSAQAAISSTVTEAGAQLMRLCTRFCGCHHHHHGHVWCGGHEDFWCPGHR